MPSDYSDFNFVEIEIVDDHIAIARMNKPERLNACTQDEHDEMAASLRRLSRDIDIHAIVLTGSGKAFSLGGTYELQDEARADPTSPIRLFREGRELMQAHLECDKPVITALNGYATGSGAAFGLLADFIIAERHVRFGDSHIKGGLAAGDGGVLIWPLTVGMIQAKKYLMTGDMLDAEEAERIGLVTEVVETGESLDRAVALARRLVAGPQLAIKATKRALNQHYRHAYLLAYEYSLVMELDTMYTDDAAAAVDSLRNKGDGAIAPWTWRR